jgi:hypothetical protein
VVRHFFEGVEDANNDLQHENESSVWWRTRLEPQNGEEKELERNVNTASRHAPATL